MFHLRLLGSVDLTAEDGSSVQSVLTQPKRLAILAYLTVARPEGFHRRDSLLAMFWPEADQARARRSLNQAIYFLRRSLGEGAIVSRGDEELGIAPAEIVCDVAELRRLLTEGNTQEALDLYRGELLPGFFVDAGPAFDHWLDAERAAVHRSVVSAARDLARRYLSQRDTAGALRWARRAIAIAPEDDGAVGCMIEAHVLAGDLAAAARALEAYRSTLAATDLDVSPEVLERLQAVLNARPAVHGRGAENLPSSSSQTSGDGPGPSGRRRWAVVAGLALAMLTAGVVAGRMVDIGAGASTAPPTRRLAVMPFKELTQGFPNDSGMLGQFAAEWLTQAIAIHRLVDVVPSQVWWATFERSAESPDMGEVRKRLAAELVVLGTYRRFSDSISFSAHLVDAESGRILVTVPPLTVDTTNVTRGVDELGQRVLGGLTQHIPGQQRLQIQGSYPPRYSTWLAWKEGIRMNRLDRRPDAIRIWEAAEKTDSLWPHIRFSLWGAYRGRGDWVKADSIMEHILADSRPRTLYDELAIQWASAITDGDLLRAERHSSQLARINPTVWGFTSGLEAARVGLYDSAVARMSRLDSAAWAGPWVVLAQSYHALGRHREEMEAALEGRARFPRWPLLQDAEITAAAVVCDSLRIARVLEESLELATQTATYAIADYGTRELRAHDCPYAASALAWGLNLPSRVGPPVQRSINHYAFLLFMAGRYEDVYGLVSEQSPMEEEEWIEGWVGISAAATGRGEEAVGAASRFRALARQTPRYAERYAIWEAGIRAWLGDTEEGMLALRRAVRAGGLPIWLHSDPRLEPLWTVPGFPPPPLSQMR